MLASLPLATTGQSTDSTAGQKTRAEFAVSVLQGIASYSRPGLGLDDTSYLPIDHVRIDPESNLTYGRGMYTAASKIGPYLLFLLKVYQAEGYYADIKMIAKRTEVAALKEKSVEANNRTIALSRLLRALDSVVEVLTQDRVRGIDNGGMLPWISISAEGKISRDKDLVPLLDNGILSWCLAALVTGLEGDEDPLAVKVHKQAEKILEGQNYAMFLDRENKMFYGEVNVRTGKGNPDYYLPRFWTEDVLAVLWGLCTIKDLAEEERFAIWDKLKAPLVEWETQTGETIDVPQGYIASNHEMLWSLVMLPLKDLPLAKLYYNSQYAQADYGVKQNVPGFQSVGYDDLGAYVKMGAPPAAEFPKYIQRHDCAIPFATAVGMMVANKPGSYWLRNVIEEYNLMTVYGPLESVGPGRRADVLSADSQYAIAAILGGGVQDEIRTYLRTHNVAGTQTSCSDFLRQIFARKEGQILNKNRLKAFRVPKNPIPSPPKRDYASEMIRYPTQDPTFDVLANLAESPDDRHGANVYSPKGQNTRWQVGPEGMTVDYSISPSAPPDTRFAWWGTFLGKDRPYLSGFTHIKVTVPNDARRHHFNILLKREDTTLVRPIVVDTVEDKGIVSDDSKWMTLTYPLSHRKRFLHLPFTYVAFTIDDPVQNPKFPKDDHLMVKSVELVNTLVPTGTVSVAESMRRVGAMPEFTPGPTRPEPIQNAVRPNFISSGAVGGATEAISHENDDLVYFEFEDVDTSNGFSGVWAKFEQMDLKKYDYMVLDVLEGSYAEAPGILRVECKYQQRGREKTVRAWNVKLDGEGEQVDRDGWRRFILPIAKPIPSGRFNMMVFLYENYVGKNPNGSLEISSPSFVSEHIEETQSEGRPLVFVAKELAEGESRSLLQDWQIQKLDSGMGGYATAEYDTRTVQVGGRGVGWAGAKLYPSWTLDGMDGCTIVIAVEPLTNAVSTGVIELKSERVKLLKTGKFRVSQKSDLDHQVREFSFPIKLRPGPGRLLDFMAISNVGGRYRIRDIRLVREPYIEEQEASAEAEGNTTITPATE